MTRNQTPKLRSACDGCHEAKVKCTGGSPCVYCKNRHQNCHYSFAARIGKPKGSRNRKTLARLREATLQAAISEVRNSSSPCVLEPVQNGVQSGFTPSTPDWTYSHSALSMTSQMSCMNTSSDRGQAAPTPPESIDFGFNNFQLQENSIAYQWQLSTSHFDESQAHFPELPFQFTGVENQESHPTFQHTNGYVSSRSPDDITCDCFQWQTSNLISLHDLMSPPRRVHNITFEDSLQAIIGTISACQLIMACQSCIKSPGMILYLTASLQMALDHLESVVHGESGSLCYNPLKLSQAIGHSSSTQPGVPSAPSQGPGTEARRVRLMQSHQELIAAQISLKETQALVISRRQRSSIDPADLKVGIYSSDDSDCLIQVAERLQASIGNCLTLSALSDPMEFGAGIK